MPIEKFFPLDMERLKRLKAYPEAYPTGYTLVFTLRTGCGVLAGIMPLEQVTERGEKELTWRVSLWLSENPVGNDTEFTSLSLYIIQSTSPPDMVFDLLPYREGTLQSLETRIVTRAKETAEKRHLSQLLPHAPHLLIETVKHPQHYISPATNQPMFLTGSSIYTGTWNTHPFKLEYQHRLGISDLVVTKQLRGEKISQPRAYTDRLTMRLGECVRNHSQQSTHPLAMYSLTFLRSTFQIPEDEQFFDPIPKECFYLQLAPRELVSLFALHAVKSHFLANPGEPRYRMNEPYDLTSHVAATLDWKTAEA